jgi:putative ABC transport system permease protein
MMFTFTMALRELRASWRRLLFFFVCVSIGVGAIVVLRSIIQSLRQGLTHEARTLIASDIIVQTNRAWTTDVRSRIDGILADAPVVARSESVETPTMVRAEKGSAVARMVELRAVEATFPFYGKLTLSNGQQYTHALLESRGAIVGPELLGQLGVTIGDRLLIAGQRFTIRGVITQEPGRRIGAFSFGSRVLVDLGDLRQTGLLSFGSRANYQLMLKVDERGVPRLTDRLRRDLRSDFVNTRSYASLEDDIGEDLTRAENYLSLVGFVIVVLGGIGVWSVTRVFVRQKIKSVAILKCVGASTRQVLSVYVAQVAWLGLAGSAMGVVLAEIAIRAIPASLTASFGGVSYGLTLSAVLQGIAVGLLVSLLFALVPLLEVRRIKPLLLLRGPDLASAPAVRSGVRSFLSRVDWLQAGTAVVVSVALVAVASWQAASVRAGVLVCGGFAAVALVLYGASWLLVRAAMPLGHARWFPLRYAVRGLRRPGNQTRVILLAVGLGCFFVIGVRALQQNLVSEATFDFGQGGADLFLIDVQPDQADAVRALLKERQETDHDARLVPTMRARVTAVRGRDVNLENYADVRGRGWLGREYAVTYRSTLERNEAISDGQFWSASAPSTPAAPPSEQEVSIEQSMHDRFKINVGDVMRFDIVGRSFDARVTSVRRVRWEDARSGGFMFVFRPGMLDKAPHTFIGFVHGPAEPTARARLQYDLVSRFPNVTAIDARDVLARIRAVMDNIVLAVSIVGGIALVSGVLILIGAVAMTKFQRVYEAAILRTLGASTRLLAAMVAIEYSSLGLLAGAIGAVGALALSWAVTRYLFRIAWKPDPVLLGTGAILTMVLVGVVGVIASAEVLRKKPLATLRAE